MSESLRSAALADMDPVTLYGVLKLRTDVFVVEQDCAYPELDGRDGEEGCLQLWAEDGGRIVATMRILRDPETLRIGRVVADPGHRGTGVARRLFALALARCREIGPDRAIVLDAQEPLEGWYGSFGFVRTGATFLEDGIPHVPMRREPEAA